MAAMQHTDLLDKLDGGGGSSSLDGFAQVATTTGTQLPAASTQVDPREDGQDEGAIVVAAATVSVGGHRVRGAGVPSPVAETFEEERLQDSDSSDDDDYEPTASVAAAGEVSAATAAAMPVANTQPTQAGAVVAPGVGAGAHTDPAHAAAPARATGGGGGGGGAPTQIAHRTRKKYKISERDWQELEGVFALGGPSVPASASSSPSPVPLPSASPSPGSNDPAAEDYRRFCLGTLGALPGTRGKSSTNVYPLRDSN